MRVVHKKQPIEESVAGLTETLNVLEAAQSLSEQFVPKVYRPDENTLSEPEALGVQEELTISDRLTFVEAKLERLHQSVQAGPFLLNERLIPIAIGALVGVSVMSALVATWVTVVWLRAGT